MLDTVLGRLHSGSYSQCYPQREPRSLLLSHPQLPEPLTCLLGTVLSLLQWILHPASSVTSKTTAGRATPNPPVLPPHSPSTAHRVPRVLTSATGGLRLVSYPGSSARFLSSNSLTVALPWGICFCCSLCLAHSGGPG